MRQEDGERNHCQGYTGKSSCTDSLSGFMGNTCSTDSFIMGKPTYTDSFIVLYKSFHCFWFMGKSSFTIQFLTRVYGSA